MVLLESKLPLLICLQNAHDKMDDYLDPQDVSIDLVHD